MSPFCRLSSLRRQRGRTWDPSSTGWTHVFLRGLKAVCNSLRCLSLKIKLGSCCFHLRKNIKRKIIPPSDSDLGYHGKKAPIWERHTLCSSFLGGGGMVSFAGDSRSTVEQSQSQATVLACFFCFPKQQLPHFQKELLKLILAASLLTRFQEKQLDRANL